MAVKGLNQILKSPRGLRHHFSGLKLGTLSLGVLTALLMALPVKAAERINLSFGAARISVPIKALEAYGETGEITPELKNYLLLLKSQDQQLFRSVLLEPYPVDSVMISQFLNSPTGSLVLDKIGQLIQTFSDQATASPTKQNSEAIRMAVLKAAQDPQGLTLLNILKQFPVDEIQFKTEALFELRNQITTLIQQRNAVIEQIHSISSVEASIGSSLDFSEKPDLRKAGVFQTVQRTITVKDSTRNREFLVDLYIPEPLIAVHRGKPNSIPVVVFSHGLAANRTSFGYLGKHLASHGFLVALPQHPGSDTNYVEAWLSGQAPDAFKVTEFIDRPLDIHNVLDELERRNSSEFNHQLNLNQVGVAGHSFGAYTALAVAGAELDFRNLKKDCTSKLDPVNIAQIFQCRALELSPKVYQFRDERVKAVMVINPVNSSIFGQQSLSQISIPVFWKTSGKDTVTPVASEQVKSFTWLTMPDKYLLLAEGDKHINFNFSGVNQTVSASLKEIVAPVPEIVNSYINAFSLAFFNVYLAQEEDYRSYLQAAYAQAISEEPYPLSLVRSITLDQFTEAIKQVSNQ